MLLKMLENAFASMDIDGATPDKSLEYDLGMDSQELVCAATQFEKIFGVRIESGDLTRSMSVFDVAIMISRKLALKSRLGTFDYGLYEDIIIKASMEVVYKALFDVYSWPQKLPHVRHIKRRYDDGMFQEFDMEMDGSGGSTISVHSVRRCEPGRIRFFQPTPPKCLRHHCGEWVLNSMIEDLTHVSTWHQWRLADGANAMFPVQDNMATADRVQSWLTEHARFVLDCWKACLEGGAQ
jgi:acyl carrier protein